MKRYFPATFGSSTDLWSYLVRSALNNPELQTLSRLKDADDFKDLCLSPLYTLIQSTKHLCTLLNILLESDYSKLYERFGNFKR
ncbi:hypothetical protein BpHYR1_040671 [Brachionus plicatilis]|uniref:Uncharacterized protein n=1 Tax=Brachionus plicatilis TaxID=10195 RepID=A0A3M7RN23_BRAPC|nr:hypothetical protein BpHYR1_040671 [Brachionus plicatilis]